MSLAKRDFFGKTVADAIKQACEALQAPQENLEIELVETGSTGIFGFIRKKAHIRARIKGVREEVTEPLDIPAHAEKPIVSAGVTTATHSPCQVQENADSPAPTPITQESLTEAPLLVSTVTATSIPSLEDLVSEDDEDEAMSVANSQEPLSSENLDEIQHELSHLLQLMGLPSQVAVEAQGNSVRCLVSGDFQKELTGQEGKTLDSVQYVLRKILARKMTERARISIDVGDFKEKRRDELEAQAKELAALVKENGKTQVIPSLNPSERRAVHMALQDDKEIRSRSVGEGLFKKVLIYKPGKGKNSRPAENFGGNENAGNTTMVGPTVKKRPSSRGGRRRKGSKPATEPTNEPASDNAMSLT